MPKRYIQTTEDILYSYEELDADAKDEAFDTWQKEQWEDHNQSQWDAEYICDDAKQIGERIGIEIKDIWYSGFWSQGDGACFTGE